MDLSHKNGSRNCQRDFPPLSGESGNPDTRRHQHKGATHDPMLGWSPGMLVNPPPPQFCKQTTYTIFSIQVTKIDENPLFDTL